MTLDSVEIAAGKKVSRDLKDQPFVVGFMVSLILLLISAIVYQFHLQIKSHDKLIELNTKMIKAIESFKQEDIENRNVLKWVVMNQEESKKNDEETKTKLDALKDEIEDAVELYDLMMKQTKTGKLNSR